MISDFFIQNTNNSHRIPGAAVSFFDYPGEPPAGRSTARLLADATDGEWAELLKHTRYQRFSPGDTVVAAGAEERSLYLVLEGELEVLVPHGRRGYLGS
jgi:hypothetical protein